jgi:transcriptional regulator with XRE-family HTH domain
MTPLKEWREKHGLSLEDLSDLVGYSPSALCRYEQGERRPSREAKIRIAKRLGLRIRDVFPLEEPVAR